MIHFSQPYIEQSCGTISHAFQYKSSGVHLSQLFADQREGRDGFAKLSPFIRILCRKCDCILGSAYTSSCKLEASDVQDVKGNEVAFTNFPQQIPCGDFHIFKDQWTGRRAFNPHLLLFRPDADPIHLPFHNKSTEVLAVHLGIYNEHIRKAGIRNELLAAVQNIIFTVITKCGCCLRAQRVGTGGWFS
ncbi:hypothetical protein D3C72_1318260 [compost metagenome]